MAVSQVTFKSMLIVTNGGDRGFGGEITFHPESIWAQASPP